MIPSAPAAPPRCLVVGAGPAGLFAAGLLAQAGVAVDLFEQNPGPGRKFLIAGKGGLNLTHSEPLEQFHRRYTGGREASWWRAALGDFGPNDLRAWASALGSETFVGTSGRVFPREMHAGRLLKAWIAELRRLGVRFHFKHLLQHLAFDGSAWVADFSGPDTAITHTAPAVLLALGGCSWPETGSHGEWIGMVERLGLEVCQFQPANCGWLARWPRALLDRAEGLPLKNISVTVPGCRQGVAGDLVITRTGLEGGPIYHLGPALRNLARPAVFIDLKPAWTEKRVRETVGRCGSIANPRLTEALRLGPGAAALLEKGPATGDHRTIDPDHLASLIKSYPVRLEGPAPIARAISTAGGVAFDSLTEDLMAKNLPGLAFAGEMLDWEAPTGGYLLQGCFTTAKRATSGLLHHLGLRHAEQRAGFMNCR